jgi:anti-anti-sigma factor
MNLTLIEHSEDQGFTIIEVVGEIDVYTAPKLRERLIGLVEAGRYQLIIDMEGVEFLDSTGLGVLVGGLKRVRAHDGWIGLVVTQNRILRIFRITGLNKTFGIYDTVAEAIAVHTEETFADAIASRTTSATADAGSALTSAAITDVIDAFTSMLDSETANESPGDGATNGISAEIARIPVSIYLAENDIHEQVETAVERWLSTANASIRTRDEPVIGSWFRRLEAGVKKVRNTPAGREAFLTAQHVADSRVIQSQDAYVTATLLQNVGPVLQALHPTKDAVVRAGALLIVKIDWVVQVHQLTAAQQAILDHQPHLVASPKEIIAALELPDGVAREAVLPGAVRPGDRGEAAAAAD